MVLTLVCILSWSGAVLHVKWVTAGPRQEAVANVLRYFSHGYLAELSDRRVSSEEALHLKLKNGEVRVYDQPSANGRQGLSR